MHYITIYDTDFSFGDIFKSKYITALSTLFNIKVDRVNFETCQLSIVMRGLSRFKIWCTLFIKTDLILKKCSRCLGWPLAVE